MSDTREDYYDLTQRIEDTFSEIDSYICTDLFRTDEEYAALRKEASSLQEAHPVITELLEGESAISLSADEHAALVRHLDLKFQIEEAERKQLYFRGHADSFAYLKRIGAI